MQIDFFNPRSIVLFIGILQGLIFAILLIIRSFRRKNQSDFWLAALLILLCLSTISDFIGFAGVYDAFRSIKDLTFFPFDNPFAYGILIYLYVQTLTNNQRRPTRRDRLLFIPAIVFYIYQFWAFAQNIEFKNWYEKAIHITYISPLYAVTSIAFNALLLILCLKHYRQYRRWLNENYSDTEKIKFDWLRNFLYVFTAMLILNAIFNLTNNFVFKLSYMQFFWLSFANALAIYYLAIAGYLRSQTIELTFTPLKIETVETETKKNPLSEVDLEKLKTRLQDMMRNDRLYLEPALTLTDLSKQIGANSAVVSYAINNGFGKNFNDFVNEFRIEEVKQKLSNDAAKNLTLLGIALDCGFNSKATFNRAFKKFTGVSPKEFQEDAKITA